MKIKSNVFGEQDADPESILTFPKGMPGFENCTRYKLFHEENDQPVVHFLQSIDDPNVSFSVVDPALLGVHYQFVLTDEEEQLLKVESSDDILVLLIAYKPQPDAGAKANINANLDGPIVLNVRTRLGMQKVLVGVQAEVILKSMPPAA
jgi:flagellar assembly factor FliW